MLPIIRIFNDKTLLCRAEGNPPPHVPWIGPVGEGTRNSTTTTSSLGNLGLGKYTCKATNDLGSDQKSYTVTRIKWHFLTCYLLLLCLFVVIVIVIVNVNVVNVVIVVFYVDVSSCVFHPPSPLPLPISYPLSCIANKHDWNSQGTSLFLRTSLTLFGCSCLAKWLVFLLFKSFGYESTILALRHCFVRNPYSFTLNLRFFDLSFLFR